MDRFFSACHYIDGDGAVPLNIHRHPPQGHHDTEALDVVQINCGTSGSPPIRELAWPVSMQELDRLQLLSTRMS